MAADSHLEPGHCLYWGRSMALLLVRHHSMDRKEYSQTCNYTAGVQGVLGKSIGHIMKEYRKKYIYKDNNTEHTMQE